MKSVDRDLLCDVYLGGSHLPLKAGGTMLSPKKKRRERQDQEDGESGRRALITSCGAEVDSRATLTSVPALDSFSSSQPTRTDQDGVAASAGRAAPFPVNHREGRGQAQDNTARREFQLRSVPLPPPSEHASWAGRERAEKKRARTERKKRRRAVAGLEGRDTVQPDHGDSCDRTCFPPHWQISPTRRHLQGGKVARRPIRLVIRRKMPALQHGFAKKGRVSES
ncbi:unnamed protein product [Diplocarpon coronariae]